MCNPLLCVLLFGTAEYAFTFCSSRIVIIAIQLARIAYIESLNRCGMQKTWPSPLHIITVDELFHKRVFCHCIFNMSQSIGNNGPYRQPKVFCWEKNRTSHNFKHTSSIFLSVPFFRCPFGEYSKNEKKKTIIQLNYCMACMRKWGQQEASNGIEYNHIQMLFATHALMTVGKWKAYMPKDHYMVYKISVAKTHTLHTRAFLSGFLWMATTC